MAAWELTSEGLKRYPHFDSQLSIEDAISLATDPSRVASHTFYPFLLYTSRWTKFAKKGEQGSSKERPIRYAARADAYIFAYYRHLLGEAYEATLSNAQLSDSITAYPILRQLRLFRKNVRERAVEELNRACGA
jgi:hypothetical protein